MKVIASSILDPSRDLNDNPPSIKPRRYEMSFNDLREACEWIKTTRNDKKLKLKNKP